MEIQEEDFLDNGSLSGEVQDELYEHYRFTADKGQEPLRIDKFLVQFIQNATRNRVQNAIRAQNVLVNDAPVKPNYKVRPGDVIRVVMPTPVREDVLIPENIPLNIVYEDDDLLVVDKPAGMVVHPGHGNYTGTLVNALAYRFQQLPSTGAMDRPGLVHRIDKDTSGLLVVAKTELAMNHLARQFFEHSISRRYKALVWGDFVEDEGTYRGNIGRNPSNRLQMAVFPDGEAGKPAVTHFRVVQRFGYVTLVECRLETGRTHQIRAHFSPSAVLRCALRGRPDLERNHLGRLQTVYPQDDGGPSPAGAPRRTSGLRPPHYGPIPGIHQPAAGRFPHGAAPVGRLCQGEHGRSALLTALPRPFLP